MQLNIAGMHDQSGRNAELLMEDDGMKVAHGIVFSSNRNP
jgi:hypothetical protein